ncbi:MAG TPA: chitobiase/beta-hexosaminidase C-terminal domain-containing protein, partial [Myxococcaceae bacterium]
IGIDNAGNTSAVVTDTYVIVIDTTPPTETANPTGGTYNSAQSVTLACSDGTGSGCASIRYTTDGSTPTATSAQYSAAITVSANTTLKFIGIDNAGNTSAVVTETYVIDTVAPTVAANPTGGTYVSAQSVVLTCNDGTGSGCASIRYTTDGSVPTATSAEYSAALTISANTTLKFIGIDNAGNPSAVATETYVIDTMAPTVAANPAGGTYNSAQSVALTCDDGTGTGCVAIHYTTDGSTPTATSPQYSDPLSFSTNTTLKFIGIDNAGNTSAVATETYVIDTVAPTVAANPAGSTYNSAQSVVLTCNDGTGTGCASIHYTTDGSVPTTASPQYSDPLTISENTSLQFLAVDNAGNVSLVVDELYVIDTVAPTTTAAPPGGVYGPAQTVTLTCDDGTGVGCMATYYTVDGSTPTTGSSQYTAPLTISANTTLKFFSVDTLGNAEAVKTQQYFIGTLPSDTSAQITAVRTAANGPISLAIRLALVTYVKPATGGDAAGFFLQAEQAGPAVFIAVNPGTLTPVPMVGDRVSLTATNKATVESMVHVTAISDFTVDARGESVEPLRADVTAIDIPVNIANYESELISISGTLLTAFAGSGTGHVSSSLSTLGTPIGNNLVLRLPTTLQDQLDLAPTCNVTAEGPLWRFRTAAQTTTYTNDDITVLSCPAPKVLSAVSNNPTTVVVKFDRRIDPASVQADGSQFTFTNGLSATAAVPQNREVQLTTVAQTGGQSYTVTVAPSIVDTRGSPVDAAANSATFTGYAAPAVLRISEVNGSITNNRDLVELLVVQGGSVAGFTLVQDSSTVLATLPAVQVATGDIIVVHLVPIASNGDAPASELTSKTQYAAGTYAANYDTAWDFLGGTTQIGYSSRALRVRDAQGATQDGAHFVNNQSPPGSFPGELQALQAEGQWLPANCGGVPCTTTSTPTAAQVSAVWTGTGTSRTGPSVRRVSATDNNLASDWLVGAHSWGLPNP